MNERDEPERLDALMDERERAFAAFKVIMLPAGGDERDMFATGWLAHFVAEREQTLALLEAAKVEKDLAYSERNKAVVGLARMALVMGWRAGIGAHVGEDWDDDWRTILFIDLPAGQVSWHFHDSERPLLDGPPTRAHGTGIPLTRNGSA